MPVAACRLPLLSGSLPRSLEVLEQRNRVAVEAQRVVDRAVLAVRRDRAHLDGGGVDLGVELDVQRQVVRKAAIEGQAAAGVAAQEVDLAHAPDGGGGQAHGHQDHGQRSRDGAEPRRTTSPGSCRTPQRGLVTGAAGPRAASGRRHAIGGQARLLGRWPNQRRTLLGRRRRLLLLEPESDHRDVVAPARLVCLAHQALDRLVERPGGNEDLLDSLLPEHRGQPVGAQEVHVARPRPVSHRVDVDLSLGPQRPGDDGALGMVLGLLVREAPLASQLLNEGMVRGQ
jgi:hypothetical protein